MKFSFLSSSTRCTMLWIWIWMRMAESVAGQDVLSKKWTLYHSLDDQWLRRGTVTLKIDHELDSTVDGNNKDQNGPIQLKVENDPECLSSETFLTSLQSSPWYRLKLQEEGSDSAVLTTVSSCQVQRANFRDELVLTFGRMGHVVSLSYVPLVSPLAPKSCDNLDFSSSKELEFTSRVSYETSVPGMTLKTILPSYQPPPGLKFISKKKTVSSQATRGEGPDGKSKKTSQSGGFGDTEDENGNPRPEQEPMDNSPFGFLRRYWYVILPVMLMNIFSAQQPEESGGQAPPQQQAQAIPAQGAASGGATTGAATKRRGKRGN